MEKMFEKIIENKENLLFDFQHLFSGDHVKEIFIQNVLNELSEEEAESITEQTNYNLFIKEILPKLLMDSVVQFSKDAIKNEE